MSIRLRGGVFAGRPLTAPVVTSGALACVRDLNGFGLDQRLAKCEDLLVHVISRRAIREFAKRHPDAGPALNDWFKLTSKAHWRSLDDVKTSFRHADLVGDCTVFNVGGNKYRLVTIIIYAVQRVYIRFVMTHAEYDKERWKHDCGC